MASFVRGMPLVGVRRVRAQEAYRGESGSEFGDVHGYTHLGLVHRRALKFRPRDLCGESFTILHTNGVQRQSSSSRAGFLARFQARPRARRVDQFSLLVKEGLVLKEFHLHTNLPSLRMTSFGCKSFPR